jgi:hypothetical protein
MGFLFVVEFSILISKMPRWPENVSSFPFPKSSANCQLVGVKTGCTNQSRHGIPACGIPAPGSSPILAPWFSTLGCFSLHMPCALTPVESQHLAIAVLWCGWLILTRYRLFENILVLSSLYKKHQALLDALTIKFIRNALRVFGAQFSGCKSVGETTKE